MNKDNLYYLYAEPENLFSEVTGVFKKITDNDSRIYHPINVPDGFDLGETKSIKLTPSGTGQALIDDEREPVEIKVSERIASPHVGVIFGQGDDKLRLEGSVRHLFSFNQMQHTSSDAENIVSINSTKIKFDYTSSQVWRMECVERGDSSNVHIYSHESDLAEDIYTTRGYNAKYDTEVAVVEYDEQIEYDLSDYLGMFW